ncbi:MAG: antirestriction protein ArdA [Lachnospiraceae bacterium]|nr:antirestriction protein ArdA [Lachnospiraceae bacterium]
MNGIYIANLGKYNEGEMVGGWFMLGQEEEELNAFLKEVVGINKEYEEWFIADTDIYDLDLEISEYENIYSLNEMFARYEELSSYEKEVVQAITEIMSGAETLDDAIDKLDDYSLYPDIQNDYDLGYAYIHEWGCVDTRNLGFLSSYIDYEALGRDLDLDGMGSFTSKGFLLN